MATNDIIYASFVPSEASLLTRTATSLYLAEFPELCSALARIFPYLLLIDNLLAVVTWSNDDPYKNFLIIVAYLTIVLYWNVLGYIVLPLILSICVSACAWSVSSVIYDSLHNEKPTLDEVIHSLHNITIRFEMLLRPIQRFPLKKRHFFTAFIMCTLLTPLHVFIMRRISSPQQYLWIGGVFFLTYHSPWLYAVRRLIWRLAYVRIFFYYLTGLDVKLDTNRMSYKGTSSIIHSPSSSDIEDFKCNLESLELSDDIKVLKKIMISPTKFEQIVRFDVLENERRWLALGWCKFLMHNERPLYCYASSMAEIPSIFSPDARIFPQLNDRDFYYEWKWIHSSWSVDKSFNDGESSDGWVYYDNNWANGSPEDGFSKYTRSRKWNRKALLTIVQKGEDHE